MATTGGEIRMQRVGTMKAVVLECYGSADQLELRDVERPAVEDDRILVRVRAASVNAGDWRVMRGKPVLARPMIGIRSPKQHTLGTDAAGIVEAVGKDVTQFRPGDLVFGARTGAFAEYVAGMESRFVPKPPNLTFEQAAAIPVAGITALQALRDHGKLQPGQRVLVNGAAGGVGTFSVQIAKALGAHVTGVCSTGNLEMVRSIGADHVLDYTREDFSRTGERYDLLVNVAGNPTLRRLRHALQPDGTLVIVGATSGGPLGPLSLPAKAFVVRRFVRQRMIFFIAKINKEDLLYLSRLAQEGKIVPVIDRTYDLTEIREAIRYVETEHARGKVIITV